jgi:hypothetical protein
MYGHSLPGRGRRLYGDHFVKASTRDGLEAAGQCRQVKRQKPTDDAI